MSVDKLEKLLVRTFPHRKDLCIDKGAVLNKAGDTGGILIIRKGLVKVTLFKNRKKITLLYYGQDSIIGLTSLFNLKGPFSLEAVTQISLEKILLKELQSNVATTTTIQTLAAEELNRQFALMADRVSELLSLNSSQLIARSIVSLAELNGEQYIEGITRKELAEYANCSIEYVFRTLSMLQRKKIIVMEGRKIGLTNAKHLKDFAFGKAQL